MTAPVAERAAPAGERARTATGWDRLVVVVAAVVALADVVFFVLIGEIIPVLAVAVVLTGAGIAVMQRRRRVGLGILGVVTLVMLAGSVPFAVDHLGHPESGVDWTHAVMGTAGRLFVLVLVAVAWRARTDASSRLVGALAVGLLGVTATVALVATAVTSGDDRQPGDIELVVDATAYPERITVASGDVLFVDNTHIFRHSFTVEGTDIDVEIPALQSVRIPIDLPPGTYDVICDIPGHEDMTSTLVVE